MADVFTLPSVAYGRFMARALSPLSDSDLPHQTADPAQLLQAWDTAMTDFLAAAEAAGPDQWLAPSPCPGWSVGDLVAHITGIERFLMGRRDPEHVPDYDALPHAQEGLSRYTEIPVDLRRSWSREEVLAEARATHADRLAQLQMALQDGEPELLGPFGKPMSMSDLLGMRILDIWIHEQDVRVASDDPGGLDSVPAWITAGRLRTALGKVWVKTVGAPEGSVAEVSVTGPGVTMTTFVAHLPGGRGSVIEPVSDPDVSVRLSWPDMVALGAGRVPAADGVERAQLAGDPDLARALVTHLTVTP